MKAIAYLCVSTEGQAREGVSLEAHRGKIESGYTEHDHQLLAVHVDAGISEAKTDNRPALNRPLTDTSSLLPTVPL